MYPVRVPISQSLTTTIYACAHTSGGHFPSSLWYHLLVFMTGPRRTAHGLVDVSRNDYGSKKMLKHLAPYFDASSGTMTHPHTII